MGASVATTASDAGADEIVNDKTEKFEEKLKDYDRVFDTLGGQVGTLVVYDRNRLNRNSPD